ncbi:hypothetical protein EON65_37180 [archaeon]|nr:MAG: hypothetical protein EON65_37180 [archaeon]
MPTNDSLRQNLTKEIFFEVEDTFNLACEPSGQLPVSKLPLALKAMGMSMNEADIEIGSDDMDFEKFLEIVLNCMKHPNWAANEMSESYSLFDKEAAGTIGPAELRSVFTRIGENLMESELEDQLKEFDIDGDLMVSANKLQ